MLGFDRVFYYPDRRRRGTPADEGLAFEEVHFRASDGVPLHGWYLPPASPSRGTVLHIHGNAANITGHYPFVGWLPAAGYGVLTFDYRGFGQSAGRVTREGTILDALSALDYLRNRKDVDPRRIVLFGQSIGAVVASVVAAERRGQVAGVIMESAFTGYRAIAAHHIWRNPLFFALAWWFPYGLDRQYDAIDYVARISPAALLLVHGKSDRITPWQMSRELFEAAREPKEAWFVDGVDHMDVWEQLPDVARRRFLAFCEKSLSR